MSTDDKADSSVPFPPMVGYVYAVVNRRAWPGLVKLGRTGSVRQRMQTYQTGDPYRAYRLIAHSDACADVDRLEKAVHLRFESARVAPKSEWFQIDEADAIAHLNTLRKTPLVTGTYAHTPMDEAEWYDDGSGEFET